MTLLIVYLLIALGFSFLCSIAEAVLLSVTTAYVSALQREGKPAAQLLASLKSDIDSPLAAILSLNTIAHTVGAAGVGAQAAVVFGNGYLGITSAVLTLLILVFSEIIPKTLGTVYWRQLAPTVAYLLKYLILLLYPLVKLSKLLTGKLGVHPTLEGFNRQEFAAMANLGQEEGELDSHEAQILQNVFALSEITVSDVMTPALVMFRLPEDSTVSLFFNKYTDQRFSRIPIYRNEPDNITGFVLRNDLLTAQARGNCDKLLLEYRREIVALPDKMSLLAAFELFIEKQAHIMYVVSEYGTVRGLITLEDILETLMGQEIVDEHDKNTDMQLLAKRRWQKRARQMGIELEEPFNPPDG